MNIKEKIGQRIRKAREKVGLTMQQVSNKTKTLKPRRISNYELGERMPGPLEAIQLAEVLNVSPAYLLCLTDEENIQSYLDSAVPILSLTEACDYKNHLVGDVSLDLKHYDHVIVTDQKKDKLNPYAFAVYLDDTSMQPEFNKGDLIIINTEITPVPSQYVLAKVKNYNHALFRKYREIKVTNSGAVQYELLSLNPDWQNITIHDEHEGGILGVMYEHRRFSSL